MARISGSSVVCKSQITELRRQRLVPFTSVTGCPCCRCWPRWSGAEAGAGPDPNLVLVGWCPEPDPDGTFGPCGRVPVDKFLDAVFPNNPSCHRRWRRRRGHREVPQLLRLQAPGLAQSDTRSVRHLPRVGHLFDADTACTATASYVRHGDLASKWASGTSIP